MSAFAALARRDFLITRSYRIAFAYDVFWGAIELVLYFFISKVVGPVPAADLAAAPSYFAFALAGILMALVVGSATSDIAARVREEQLTGTLELLCAQPLRSASLALGTAAWPLSYAVVRVVGYLALAVVALDLATEGVDWLGVAVMLLLGAASFLGLGVLAAAATVVFKRGGSIVDLAVFAMTFVSGAVFPLTVLPDWLEPVGKAMPTRFAFDGLRDALFAGGGWGTEAAVLAAVAIVSIPLSLALFEAALRHARRRGTLAQY